MKFYNIKPRLILCLMTSVVIFNSCTKDFLDRKPLNLLSEASVWEDPELIKLSVNEFYGFLNTGFINTYLPAAITDEIQLIGNEQNKITGFVTGDFFHSDFPQRNLWKDLYGQIRKANYFIENAERSTVLNESMRDELVGQARFFRAYLYFYVFSNFKDAPIILKAQKIEEAEDKPLKVTHDKGVEFITEELEKAATELPRSYNSKELGRITSTAAQAFLSRVLLWQASVLNNPTNDLMRWQKAAAAAKKVMNSEVFALQADYNDPFLKKNILVKPEVIIEHRYNGIKGEKIHSFDKTNSPVGYGGRGVNCPTQEIVDAYEMKNGMMINEVGSGYLASSPYIGRDPRFEKSILYNQVPFKGRPVEIFTGGKDLPTSNPTPTGYYIRKFIAEEFDYNKDLNVYSSNNWIIMRYAEVLLNYAEAQNEAVGPDISVYECINLIRARVKMKHLPENLTQDQMRDKIRHERRIELAFEDNIRYNDLRRWKTAHDILNKAVSGVSIKKENNGSFSYTSKLAGSRVFTDKNYWLPIPLTEIAINPNLKPQNPGW